MLMYRYLFNKSHIILIGLYHIVHKKSSVNQQKASVPAFADTEILSLLVAGDNLVPVSPSCDTQRFGIGTVEPVERTAVLVCLKPPQDIQRNAHAVRVNIHALNVKLDKLAQPRYLARKQQLPAVVESTAYLLLVDIHLTGLSLQLRQLGTQFVKLFFRVITTKCGSQGGADGR